MINDISQPSPAYGLSAAGAQPNAVNSTDADLVSSFKEILSVMMAANSGISTDQQLTSGMSDLMAPLMMILLEKLVEGQMEQETPLNAAALYGYGKKSEPSGRPVGGVLTQNFHPGHNGLDFGIPAGTPIKATMDGKVVHAGWNNQGYGNLVIVENGAYKTYYAHLSSIPVAVGDYVTSGSTIGLSGNTGNSTGPHLHYEIRKDNVPVNPTSITLGT